MAKKQTLVVASIPKFVDQARPLIKDHPRSNKLSGILGDLMAKAKRATTKGTHGIDMPPDDYKLLAKVLSPRLSIPVA